MSCAYNPNKVALIRPLNPHFQPPPPPHLPLTLKPTPHLASTRACMHAAGRHVRTPDYRPPSRVFFLWLFSPPRQRDPEIKCIEYGTTTFRECLPLLPRLPRSHLQFLAPGRIGIRRGPWKLLERVQGVWEVYLKPFKLSNLLFTASLSCPPAKDGGHVIVLVHYVSPHPPLTMQKNARSAPGFQAGDHFHVLCESMM